MKKILIFIGLFFQIGLFAQLDTITKVGIGAYGGDGTGDLVRPAMIKLNHNDSALLKNDSTLLDSVASLRADIATGGVSFSVIKDTVAVQISDSLSNYSLSTEISQEIRDSINILYALQQAQFTDNSGLAYKEGTFYYSADDYGFIMYNEFSDIKGNIMYEMWKVVRNTSGDDMLSGTPVIHHGTATGPIPNIDIAGCGTQDSADVIGITTMAIAANAIGIICTQGQVHDMLFPDYDDGDDLYLSINGTYTLTPPQYPLFATKMVKLIMLIT